MTCRYRSINEEEIDGCTEINLNLHKRYMSVTYTRLRSTAWKGICVRELQQRKLSYLFQQQKDANSKLRPHDAIFKGCCKNLYFQATGGRLQSPLKASAQAYSITNQPQITLQHAKSNCCCTSQLFGMDCRWFIMNRTATCT